MNASHDYYFDHEKLVAYRRSIKFAAWASELIEQFRSRLAVCDQLDRASTSVPLNIAEGNGKYTAPDRCRYFENARGSALECAACLDVLHTLALKLIESGLFGLRWGRTKSLQKPCLWDGTLAGAHKSWIITPAPIINSA
jgi:four helix bundle protein